MKEGQPIIYSPETFAWSMPPYDKEQTLSTGLAEAGFIIQDLLLDVTVEGGKIGSSVFERRKIEFENIEFIIPDTDTCVEGSVTIEQSKSSGAHLFSVTTSFPTSLDSQGFVYLSWGVDNPEYQRINVIVRDINEDGVIVGSRSGGQDWFTHGDKTLLLAVLDATLAQRRGVNG